LEGPKAISCSIKKKLFFSFEEKKPKGCLRHLSDEKEIEKIKYFKASTR
jgi:hypothetical protein